MPMGGTPGSPDLSSSDRYTVWPGKSCPFSGPQWPPRTREKQGSRMTEIPYGSPVSTPVFLTPARLGGARADSAAFLVNRGLTGSLVSSGPHHSAANHRQDLLGPRMCQARTHSTDHRHCRESPPSLLSQAGRRV